jgi:hypothetical protein
MEYAHSLLQQLEIDTTNFKNQSQRQRAQAELQQQKDTAKNLDERLKVLDLLVA